MARAHFVKKARKDVEGTDIKKGESYYWWKFQHRARCCSRTPPKPSQLTSSEFLGTMYAIEERLAELSTEMGIEDLKMEVEEIVGELESLSEQTSEKLSNMPDQLQEGDVGQMLQSRCDEVDSMVSDLESIEIDIDEEEIKIEVMDNNERDEGESKEDYDEDIKEAIEQAIEDKKQEILDEIQGVAYNGE